MSQQNKAVSRKVFEEAASKKNLALLDQLFASNIVYHGPGMEVKGIQGAKEMMGMYFSAFPDLRMTVESQVAEGDLVATRWRATGTHKGDMPGLPATGKKAAITGITIDRIVGGKIAEQWESFDQLGMMQQLGAVPSQ